MKPATAPPGRRRSALTLQRSWRRKAGAGRRSCASATPSQHPSLWFRFTPLLLATLILYVHGCHLGGHEEDDLAVAPGINKPEKQAPLGKESTHPAPGIDP